jgi:hypothetical protein
MRQRAMAFLIPAVRVGLARDAINHRLPRLIKARDGIAAAARRETLRKLEPSPDTSFVLANFDPYLRQGRLLDLGPPAK